MHALTKYISRQLLITLSVGTVALTAAVWLTQSLRLVDMIVNRGLPVSEFLRLALLMLPTCLVIILPIVMFAAVLFTYNRLVSDSELVVMRAAGLSHFGLAKPALLVGMTVAVFCYVLTLYLMPMSYREFKDLQFALRSDYSTVMLREGTFNTLRDDLTVYVRERKSNGELLGILVHDQRIPDQPVTLIAERGALARTSDGPRVIMFNGNRQEVERDRGQLSLLYFDRYALDVGRLGGGEGQRWREPRERFVTDLLAPGDGPNDMLYRDELIAEGHQRLASPLYALALTLVGLAAVLFGTFERRGQARRIIAAVVVGIAIEGIALGMVNLSVRQSWAIFAVYGLPLGLILGGLYLLREQPVLSADTTRAKSGDGIPTS